MTQYEKCLSEAKQARETAKIEDMKEENARLKSQLASMAQVFEASEIRSRWFEAENKNLRELLASKNVSK